MDVNKMEQTTIWGAVGRPLDKVQRFYEDGVVISQLAQIFDCSTTAIIDDLLEFEFVEQSNLYPDELPQLRTAEYERIVHGPHRVYAHRLLMVAECGFEAVADATDIHHESFRWDNRLDALVLCATREEHMALHADGPDGDHEDQQELSEFDEQRQNRSLDEFTQVHSTAETGTT